MKLRQNRALDGATWVRSGLRLVLSQPMALGSMLGFVSFTLGLLTLLPWIGPLLVAVILPGLSAGWVHTVERIQRGERPIGTMLIAPLRSAAKVRLLQLGLLYGMVALMMLTLADQIDPALAQSWDAMRQARDDDSTMIALENLQAGLTLRVALLVPVALLFWHAPVLIDRDPRVGVAQALFGSALASLRNLPAFVVYGLCWLGADLALSTVLGAVLGLLGLPQLAMLVAVPVALLFSASFYASLHASVMGCIDFGDAAAPPVDTPDQ